MCIRPLLVALCTASLPTAGAVIGPADGRLCRLAAPCDEGGDDAPSLLQRAAERRARSGSPEADAPGARRPRGTAAGATARPPRAGRGSAALLLQALSAARVRPRSWSAQVEDDEIVLVLLGGLAATSLFLLGVAAYQRAHGLAGKRRGPEGPGAAERAPEGQPPAWGPEAARSCASSGASPPGAGGAPGAARAPFHLCDALIVPAGKRLVCRVACQLQRERQATEFDVTSSLSRGLRSLIRVRAAETESSASRPRVVIEHPGDGEPLAALSTEDLYRPQLAEEDKMLGVLSPSGIRFGAVKRSGGNYLLTRSDGSFLLFKGRFWAHDVQVLHGDRTVANTERVDAEAYQVSIESGVDAGLVLLGLLAVDKCERLPAQQRGWSLGFVRAARFAE